MGVDLTLMPVTFVMGNESYCCQTVLRLERDYELQDAIKQLNSNEAPGKCSGHFGDKYTDEDEDAYGGKLRYVKAGDLAKLSRMIFGCHRDNIAALAYVATLPVDHKIVLYWS